MAIKLQSSKETSRDTESQAKVLMLLALWDLASPGTEVKRTEVTNRVKRDREKVEPYRDFLEQLEKDGAVVITKGRVVKVSLSKPHGLETLSQGLRESKFVFEGSVKVWAANALLRWIREMDVQATTELAEASKSQIKSYEEFSQIVLDTYDRLNLGNLVPIYRIRREIGERVARKDFDEWLLEMQSNDIVQLIGGEMPDISPDKVEDSIKIDLGGSQSVLRYYIQLYEVSS
jgi:hypothetical protein